MAMGGGIGQMVFSMLFNFLLMMLFAPKPKDTISYGPRLDNFKPAIKDIQGQVINLTYGTTRVSGTIFWASDIRETIHEDVTEYDSGKGGSSYTHTDVTYTYDCDFAVGICEGIIVGIRKIWANKELIYDVDQIPNRAEWLRFTLYNGSEDQSPSPLMQAHLGYSNVTAHRGLAYIVFEQFQLDPFGRRVPQSVEFEVVAKGVPSANTYIYPQINYANFKDRGNYDSTTNPPPGAYNTSITHSIVKLDNNTFAFPVTSDPYIANAILHVPSSNVVKFPLSLIPSVFNGATSYWCNSYGWPWASRTFTQWAWFNLPYGGGGALTYKPTPCLSIDAVHCSWSGGTILHNKNIIVNAINGVQVCTLLYADAVSTGSFTYSYSSGIWNNRINHYKYYDGTGYNYQHDARSIMELAPVSINTEVDQYGFLKTTLSKNISGLSKLYSVKGGVIPNQSFNIYLNGFPKDHITECSEPDDWGYNYDETFTTTTYEFDVLDINITYTEVADIKFENYNNSIHDTFDFSKQCAVKIKITKRVLVKYCHRFGTVSDTTTVYTTWLPAEVTTKVGIWDADPLPAEYDQYGNLIDANQDLSDTYAIIVNYVSYTGILNNDIVPAVDYWLKFKNGSELLSLYYKHSSGSNIHSIFYKPPYTEYRIVTYTDFDDYYENVGTAYDDPISAYFGFMLYSQYTSSLTYKTVSPNDWFDTNKTPISIPTTKFSCYLSNDYIKQNSLPFGFVKNGTIPVTAYWDRGLTDIYYTSGTNIRKFSLLTFEDTSDVTTTVGFQNIIPYGEDYIGLYTGGGSSYLGYVKKIITPQEALLGEIIEDLSEKANIDLSLLDISEEAYNVKVYGYNVSDDMKLLNALEPLLMNYFIDAFESEWKLKFRTRKEYLNNQNNIKTINKDELGIKGLGEDYNEQYKIIIREDIELPESLSYTYIAAENSFSQANVIAIRNIDYNLGIKTSVKAPIAMLTNEAYANAFRLLFDVWRSNKEIEFRLPKSYSFIEPGDIVLLPLNASKYTNEYMAVKIFEVVSQSNAFLELKGLEEDARNMNNIVLDGAYEKEYSTLIPITPTYCTIINSRPLYNKFTNIDYDNPGVYVGFYGTDAFWRGGSLYASYDNGVVFNQVLPSSAYSAPTGSVISATDYKITTNKRDRKNSIKFSTLSIQEFFSTSDDDIIYREGNLVAVISAYTSNIEFLTFRNLTVDPNNSKIITISDFTRGLYETYDSSYSIKPGDRIVLLPLGFKKLNVNTQYYNSAIPIKSVSMGQALENVPVSTFYYNLKWYYPYKVANFDYSITGTNDIKLTWNSRERNKPNYIFYSPEILDVKEYTLYIYKYDGTLLRTETSITSDTYTYTAANIAADGITIGTALRFVLKRKAEFLEYNHTVENELLYGDTAAILNAISNNKLVYHISLNRFTGLTKETSNPSYTATYNNYNGDGHPNVTTGFYNKTTVKSLYGDSISIPSIPCHLRYTVCGWIKVPKYIVTNEGGWAFNATGCGGQYDGGIKIAIKGDGSNTNIWFQDFGSSGDSYYIPHNTWVFYAYSYSHDISGRPFSYYLRSIDDSVIVSFATNSNNGWWGSATPAGTNTIGTVTSNGTGEIHVQDTAVFSGNLYLDAGNSFSKYEEIFNLGKQLWQTQ